MPKLVLFAACEKVLIDQSNNVSLISLLEELKFQVAESGPKPPANAKAAYKWDVLTEWARIDSDIGKRYAQRIALYNPAGEPTGISTTSDFDTEKATSRVVVTIVGFPIGSVGRHTLKLWLSENGQETPEPIAEYTIAVTREVLKK